MSALVKNLLISPAIGFAAFLIDQYIKTGSLQLPDNSAHLISLVIYILAVFAGGLLVSGTGTHDHDYEHEHEHEARESGTVKWFNSKKGYGFITRDRGDDVFVHYRNIEGDGRRSISDGQRVTFVVIHGDKGLQAEEVEVE